MGGISVQIHQVPTKERHFISGGQATITVCNYDTKNTKVNGAYLNDGFGNSFSVMGMDRFNSGLSEGDAKNDFKDFVAEAKRWGISMMVDFIPWLAPDAINEKN